MLINVNLRPQHLLALGITLAGLAGFTLFYTLWQWHNDWELAHETIAMAPTQPNETAHLIAAIPNDHLFGKSLAAGDMPISSLQLQVTGIVKSDDENGGEVSKAYISMAGNPSKIYQVGDSLPYGVKVYQIANNAVILENDGHLEKLPLPRAPLQFKPRDTTEES